MTVRLAEIFVGQGRGVFGAVKRKMNYPRVRVVIDDATAPDQNREHAAIVATDVGLELSDSFSMSDTRQVLNQQWPDTLTLVFIKHRERDGPNSDRRSVARNLFDSITASFDSNRYDIGVSHCTSLHGFNLVASKPRHAPQPHRAGPTNG
jgi:hypothetical protein